MRGREFGVPEVLRKDEGVGVYSLRVPAVVLGLVVSCLAVVLWLAPAFASPNGVVISELRFRGPEGANDEFVEIKNTSTSPVDISGYRLQGCASSSGAASDRVAVPANTTLQPDQYYLFTNSSATGGYSGAAPGDRTYTTGFSDTAGSQSGARLVDSTGAPIDGVGLPASPCREGTGLDFPTANGPSTAFERKPLGANDQDTDDNAADFEGPKAGNPQNSGGDTAACSDGVDNDNDGKIDFEDANPNPSEGVFVGYVRDRQAYQPGDVVRINGEVSEKFGQTQINETVNQEPAKTGTAPVPTPFAIDEARAEGQEAPARPYYESLEGMRVGLDTGVANSGGTNKFGELFLTPGPEKDRVFRDEVVAALIAADSDAGAGDPDNPYRDPDGSTTEVNGDLFDTVSGTVGPLAYGFENY